VSVAFYYYYKCTSTSNDITKKINKLPPQVKTRNYSDEFSFDMDEFSLSHNNTVCINDDEDDNDEEFTLMSDQ
jgi:hypothetical protein